MEIDPAEEIDEGGVTRRESETWIQSEGEATRRESETWIRSARREIRKTSEGRACACVRLVLGAKARQAARNEEASPAA